MKRFFIKCAAMAATLLVPFALYFGCLQSLPNLYEGSLMGVTSKKLSLLSEMESPKIVVAGGSSTPYSVVCADVEAALDMPCFNLGTTAYLGLPFFLKQLRSHTQAGDVVVLSLEYAVYSGERSYTTVWCAMENHANVWREIPLSYWPGLLGSYYHFARDKLALYRQVGAPQGDLDAHYAEAGLGPRGDNLQPRENILEHKYNVDDCRIVNADTVADEVISQLNAFARWAKRNGVTVYLTSAPFNRLALSDAPDGTSGLAGVDALEARLRAECTLPWLGTLRDGVMDEALFFNSNNHLNTQGAQVFTAALIEQLRAVGVGTGGG